MRTLILILTFICGNFIAAQTLTEDFKMAIANDDAESFKQLLNSDNLNACFATGNSNYTLLALTIKANASRCFKVLIEEKSDLEKSCTSKSPLMYATKYGYLKLAKALILAGANPNFKNSKGRTALDYAKKYEQKELITYLSSL